MYFWFIAGCFVLLLGFLTFSIMNVLWIVIQIGSSSTIYKLHIVVCLCRVKIEWKVTGAVDEADVPTCSSSFSSSTPSSLFHHTCLQQSEGSRVYSSFWNFSLMFGINGRSLLPISFSKTSLTSVTSSGNHRYRCEDAVDVFIISQPPWHHLHRFHLLLR